MFDRCFHFQLIATNFQIVNVENGRTMKTYERGEVCVRGPQIMVGYLGNVRATTETIDQDGWLHTGWYDAGCVLYRDALWNCVFLLQLYKSDLKNNTSKHAERP